MEDLMQSADICIDTEQENVTIFMNTKDYQRLEGILKSYHKKLQYNAKRYHAAKSNGRIERLENQLQQAKAECEILRKITNRE